MKYLTLVLSNGKEFRIKGETVNDVPDSAVSGEGWSAFELTNGKNVQIRSNQIVTICESDTDDGLLF